MHQSDILILGANGFVGKELTKAFLEENIPIKALVRNPKKLSISSDLVEIITGDLSVKESLKDAFEGVRTIYYLVHGMNQKGSFIETEKEQAQNVASYLTSDMRLIYLSGLGTSEELSEHLKSRHQVGEILRSSKASVIELRASIILGEGSLSFELMRGIVERFPAILNTSWSNALCQPLSKKDLLNYLVSAKDISLKAKSEVIEIAGPEKITYEGLLSRYAKIKKLKRPVLSIEHFPRSLAQKAIDLFLPEYSQVGAHLLDSIEIPTTANLTKAQSYFQEISPMGVDQAIEEATQNSQKNFETLDYKKIFSMGFNTQELGATVLKDEIYLSLPLKHERIIKILEKAQTLSEKTGFLPFKLPKLSYTDNLWKLELPSLEASENYLSFIVEGSELKGVHIFKPKRFFEAETFLLYQKSKEKILDFFKTITTKLGKD